MKLPGPEWLSTILLAFSTVLILCSVWLQWRLFRQLDRDRQDWIERQHSFLGEAIKASEIKADVENLKLAVKRLTGALHN